MNKLRKAVLYLIFGYILTYQFIVLKVMGIFPKGSYFEVHSDILGIITLIGAIFEIVGLIYVSKSVRAIALQKKKTEEEIHTLAQGIEQTAEGIAILDTTGCIQYVNKSYEKISGFDRDKLIGTTFNSIPVLSPPSEKAAAFWETLKSGSSWKERSSHHHQDGHVYTMEVIVSPIYNLQDEITSLIVGCHDITQDLEREQRMIQMQKLESIGTFVGGIAHDFNNILTAVIGNTELALDETQPSTQINNKLKDVLFSANRGKEVIQQLVAYGRKEESKAIVTDFQTNIREALKLLRAVIPRSIKTSDSLCFCEDKIMAVPGQIHQIIMNLGTNSANSMNYASGTISVNLETIDLDSNSIAAFPELGSIHCYKLTFADSGCGITPEIIDRIFDPYFTTNQHTESSGLGLSIVQSIVHSQGGAIRVESKIGEGSKFIIYIPRFEAEIENSLFL